MFTNNTYEDIDYDYDQRPTIMFKLITLKGNVNYFSDKTNPIGWRI